MQNWEEEGSIEGQEGQGLGGGWGRFFWKFGREQTEELRNEERSREERRLRADC